MKKIIIFVALVMFVVAQPSEERREEIRQRRREHDKVIAECILKSEAASPELKKIVEENQDGNLMKALHPRDHKLEKSDREVFRNCRKEMIEKMKEGHRREIEKHKDILKNLKPDGL